MIRWLPLLFLPGCIDWASLYQSGQGGQGGPAQCGNGRAETGEECDDGNQRDTDACLNTCKWATCGDGKVRTGAEECDDNNTVEGDGCSSQCLRCISGTANFLFPENGHCYSRHDEVLTWDGAEGTCDARGGYLATLVSNHEAIAIETNLLGPAASSTWIGMSDKILPGTYAWITYEPVQWSRWAGPRTQNGCAVQRFMAPGIDWVATDCERTLGFVCEQAPPTMRPETHHAYRPLFDRVSWFDARDACARSGGYLVTISDQAENAFVATLTPGEFWIGAMDPTAGPPPGDGGSAAYNWVTGEPVGPTFFAPGEPDYADGAKCLIMGVDKGWHDRACNSATWFSPYVCEFD